jgi:hypothetical protein
MADIPEKTVKYKNKHDEVAARRSAILYYQSMGLNYTEIAKILNIGYSTLRKDIMAIRQGTELRYKDPVGVVYSHIENKRQRIKELNKLLIPRKYTISIHARNPDGTLKYDEKGNPVMELKEVNEKPPSKELIVRIIREIEELERGIEDYEQSVGLIPKVNSSGNTEININNIQKTEVNPLDEMISNVIERKLGEKVRGTRNIKDGSDD